MVFDYNGKVDIKALDTRNIGFEEKGRTSDKLCAFIQLFQKHNAALHSACVTKNTACAGRLLGRSPHSEEKLPVRKELKN